MKTTIACLIWGLALMGRPGWVGAEPRGVEAWSALPVPGGLAALAEAAHLPPPAAPERAFADIVRAVHDRPAPVTLAAVRAHLAGARDRSETADDHVPLPLTADFWTRVVLRRPVPLRGLAEAVLADRRASLLYVGLLALEASTLALVADDEALAGELHTRYAAALAAFGRSLSIANGVVQVPGGPEAQPVWTRLAGVPPDAPARFITALLGRDRGRLAFFYDTVDQLPADARRFALGAAGDAAARAARAASLYRTFRDVAPEWRADERPFLRPAVSPLAVLRELAVTPDGELAPPGRRAFWAAHFEGRRPTPPGRDDDRADAAWIVGQVFASGGRDAGPRLDAIVFAQRLAAAGAGETTLGVAVEGRLRYPALAEALERLSIGDGDLLAAATARADALTALGDERLLLQFQAALSLVERMRHTRALGEPAAQIVVGELVASAVRGPDGASGVMAWLQTSLVPALRAADPEADDAERLALRALAGVSGCRSPADDAAVAWEGRRYRVDPGVAALERIERARQAQGGPTLAQVVALDDWRMGHAAGAAPARWLAEWAATIEPESGWSRDLARTVSVPVLPGDRAAAARLVDAALTDALVALVYAPHLGQSFGPARYGGHVARRHDLGLRASLGERGRVGPWTPPVERLDGRTWRVVGSVLGLDVPLARLSLRRIDPGLVPARPRLSDEDRRRFLAALAAIDTCDLHDADRDAIHAALEAGRRRVTALAGRPGELEATARQLGLPHERVHGLVWAAARDGGDLVERFSFGELLELGREVAFPTQSAAWGLAGTVRSPASRRGGRGGWGASSRTTRAAGGAADVLLWLADILARLDLPAALAEDLLGYVMQEVLDGANPAHADDSLAVSVYLQRLPASRVEDYVAALAADGPLREVGARGVTESR